MASVARAAVAVMRLSLAAGYRTPKGAMYQCKVEEFLASEAARRREGEVQLILTSPPFPLNHKKNYGNHQGEEFTEWLAGLAPSLAGGRTYR